jgi:tetratricopeptide (TPR) repeat protein
MAYETSDQIRLALGIPVSMRKYFILGSIALDEGNLSEAYTQFEQLRVHVDTPDNTERAYEMAWVHFLLGSYYLVTDTPTEAQPHFEASSAYFQTTQQTIPLIDVLNKLGYTALAQGDIFNAVASFRKSIALGRSHRYRRAIATSLFGLAAVTLDTGNLAQAAHLFGAAEALSEMTIGVGVDERSVVQRHIALLQEQLDPATLAAYWAEGRALDWEHVVALSLEAGA